MKRKYTYTQPENLIFILRNQFQLTDEQLLSIQICAFTSIKELIQDRANDGNVYDAHLLFSNYESAAAVALRKEIIDRCEDMVAKSVPISPLLVSRMASETVNEVISFISNHFKKNSFESILEYFKLNDKYMNGIMLYN